MNKELVPPELYFELRDLGIEPYSFVHKAELEKGIFYSQAFRWFREKYGLFASFVEYTIDVLPEIYYMFTITGGDHYEDFNTYEEAELACLKKLIEILKNK